MGRARIRVAALALAVSLLAGHPAAAYAGWPLGASAPVLLGFGVAYTSGSGSRTHSGVDLGADAGARVNAPLSGVVRFVGRVPADGGGTVAACTIELADGTRLTLLPLESTSVHTGDRVEPGKQLGELAASGDGSSAGSHLHISARHGELYVDPMPLFAAPAAPSPTPVTAPVPAPVTVPLAASPSARPHASAGSGPAVVIGDVALAASGASAPAARAQAATPRVERATARTTRGVAPRAAAPNAVVAAAPQRAAVRGVGAGAPAPTASALAGPAAAAGALGLAFGLVLLGGSRRFTARLARAMTGVRPVRDAVAAAADRC